MMSVSTSLYTAAAMALSVMCRLSALCPWCYLGRPHALLFVGPAGVRPITRPFECRVASCAHRLHRTSLAQA